MASLGDLIVRIVGDNSQLDNSITSSRQKLADFGDSAVKAGRALTVGLTAPLTAAATAFVVMADKQIQAEAALTNAIRATGREAEISVESLKEFTAELQSVTTFGDEAQLSALALTQQLANLDQDGLEAVLPGMLDFATAMGVDLQTTASLFGKTLGSTTNALTRYGIEIDTAASPTEKLAQLTEALEEKFGGAARAAAEAGLGPFRQMKNAAGDLAEEFGTILLPAVNSVVEVVQSIIGRLSGMDDETKRVILTVGGLAAALGPLALSIGLVSKALAAFAAPPTGAIVIAVIAVVALTTAIVTLIRRKREYERQIGFTRRALEALTEAERQAERVALVAAREKEVETIRALNTQLRELRKVEESETSASFTATLAIADLNDVRQASIDKMDALQASIVEIDRVSTAFNQTLIREQEELDETTTSADELLEGLKDLSDGVGTLSDKWRTWQGLQKQGHGDEKLMAFLIGRTAAAEEEQTKSTVDRAEVERRRQVAALAALAARADAEEEFITRSTAGFVAMINARRDAAVEETADIGLSLENRLEDDMRHNAALVEIARVSQDEIDAIRDAAAQAEADRIEKIRSLRQQTADSILDIADGLGQRLSNLIDANIANEEEAERKKLAIIRTIAVARKAAEAFATGIAAIRATIEALPNLALSLATALAGVAAVAAILATPIPGAGSVASAPSVALPGIGGAGSAVTGGGSRLDDVASATRPDRPTGAGDDEGTRIIVNLDGKPILDAVARGSRNRTLLIDQGAVV